MRERPPTRHMQTTRRPTACASSCLLAHLAWQTSPSGMLSVGNGLISARRQLAAVVLMCVLSCFRAQVKVAMNTINAEQRLRVAAADKAEAAKIKVGCLVAKAHNLKSHNAAMLQDLELLPTPGCPWAELCNDQSKVSAEAHGKKYLMHQHACLLCWACRAPPCTGCVCPFCRSSRRQRQTQRQSTCREWVLHASGRCAA